MLPRLLLIVILLVLGLLVARGQTRERITYDDAGRIATVTYIQGSQALRLRYDYDARGNITRTHSELVAGVSEEPVAGAPHVTVYPNPSSQHVVIEASLPDGTEADVTIRSGDGKVVVQERTVAASSGTLSLDVDADAHALASGTYRVTIVAAGRTMHTAFVLTR